jgi:hypothetical protein
MKQLVIVTVAVAFLAGGLWGQKAVDKADMLKDPAWKKIYDDYHPDAELIANLKNRAPELKADV